MNLITEPMFRYGEPDFDRDYMRWGLHDRETQLREAASILTILAPAQPLRMLDLACGIGTHAIAWAQQGHRVTAIDLSQTFLDEGRRLAEEAGVAVDFQVMSIQDLDFDGAFDVVTWIEPSFSDEAVIRSIHRALRPGGHFLLDVRNPDHPRTQSRTSNWRTWREEDGVFHLERHETDPETGLPRDEWIEIDTVHDRAVRRVAGGERRLPLAEKRDLLWALGFETQLRTMAGEPFTHGEEPYWLWMLSTRR